MIRNFRVEFGLCAWAVLIGTVFSMEYEQGSFFCSGPYMVVSQIGGLS